MSGRAAGAVARPVVSGWLGREALGVVFVGHGGDMSEKILFDEGAVKVTDTRAIIGGLTYAIVNISSVGLARDNSVRLLGVLTLLIAAVFSGVQVFLVGAALGVLGVLLIVFGVRYHVNITSGAGEKHALTSRDVKRSRAVASAINLAIMHQSRRARVSP
jgi:hypothetical protein